MKLRTPSRIGSGAYELPVQQVFLLGIVHSAVKFIECDGRKAFETMINGKMVVVCAGLYLE